jgi:predicted DNA-binding transcriptional regulator YafY
MARATGPQRAERLNRALQWLRQGLSPPETIARLAAVARISWRQAYRYVQQARGLKRPLPVGEAKVVFTVKLPRSLVDQLHRYAETTGETLSEIMSRALWAVLRRGGGRG